MTTDLRAFTQVLAAKITPTPAKPTKTLALLPSVVIPTWIEQMSRINSCPPSLKKAEMGFYAITLRFDLSSVSKVNNTTGLSIRIT